MDNQPLNEPDDEAGRPSLVKPWDPASATMPIHYPMRELLLADERAEYDTLMQQLPPAERGLVRVIEIFMVHQLNQAAMLNDEIRHGQAQIGLRLKALEAAANPAMISGMHAEMTAQTEAIGIIGDNLVNLAAQLRGLPERVATLERTVSNLRRAPLYGDFGAAGD